VDGGRDVWRVPDAGGVAERMTHDGGFLARESPDGRTLFYTRSDGRLLARPLAGGEGRVIADCVWPRTLADGPDGMYYLGCAADQPRVPLLRYSPARGRSELVGSVDVAARFAANLVVGGFMGGAVSADGQTILFSPLVAGGSDLMLIENFR
jgi:hypothetical protein